MPRMVIPVTVAAPDQDALLRTLVRMRNANAVMTRDPDQVYRLTPFGGYVPVLCIGPPGASSILNLSPAMFEDPAVNEYSIVILVTVAEVKTRLGRIKRDLVDPLVLSCVWIPTPLTWTPPDANVHPWDPSVKSK